MPAWLRAAVTAARRIDIDSEEFLGLEQLLTGLRIVSTADEQHAVDIAPSSKFRKNDPFEDRAIKSVECGQVPTLAAPRNGNNDDHRASGRHARVHPSRKPRAELPA